MPGPLFQGPELYLGESFRAAVPSWDTRPGGGSCHSRKAGWDGGCFPHMLAQWGLPGTPGGWVAGA